MCVALHNALEASGTKACRGASQSAATACSLTVPVEKDGQVLLVVGADVEEQGRGLRGAEAQGDVLPHQGQVGEDGGGQAAGVPVQLVRLLEGVRDRGLGLEDSRHLWKEDNRGKGCCCWVTSEGESLCLAPLEGRGLGFGFLSVGQIGERVDQTV